MQDNAGDVLGDVVGDPWERLFPKDWAPSKPDVPPRPGRPPSRTQCDIKRLPAHTMGLYGRNPETDEFFTVVCAVCGTLVVPHVLRDHMKKHGGAAETLKSKVNVAKKPSESTTLESDVVVCCICYASVAASSYRRHVLKVHGDESGKVKTAPWERLFPRGWTPEKPDVPPSPARPPSRSLSDVKRLPAQDMALFGRRPEADPFCTVVCPICSTLVTPQALSGHLSKHGDAAQALQSKIYLADDGETDGNVICYLCNASVSTSSFRRHVSKVHGDDPSAVPIKVKTAKKLTVPKKSASSSPPDLTDELSKDVRKSIKSRKSKSPTLPELELMLPTAKRPGLTGGPPELHPAELPKKIGNSKKKIERKPDKVYDPNKNCGVINEAGKPCLRSILCKVHLVAHKRAVLNRSLPYDALTKMLKAQGEEDRRPKQEPVEAPLFPVGTPLESCFTPAVWPESQEPPVKRFKTEDVEEDQFPEIPSDLDALIEAALKETKSPLAVLPVAPRPEPLVRWSLETPTSPPTPPPPPVLLADLPWHTAHPRPLATNTFGCRLVGGLMTKSKKLEAFRKHVQSVWGSPSKGSPDSPTKIHGFSVRPSSSPLNKKLAVVAPRRRRKTSGTSPNATSELITGILQRAANTVPQNGVNGVPLRLLPTSMPGTQPAFIQLNLCPSK